MACLFVSLLRPTEVNLTATPEVLIKHFNPLVSVAITITCVVCPEAALWVEVCRLSQCCPTIPVFYCGGWFQYPPPPPVIPVSYLSALIFTVEAIVCLYVHSFHLYWLLTLFSQRVTSSVPVVMVVSVEGVKVISSDENVCPNFTYVF